MNLGLGDSLHQIDERAVGTINMLAGLLNLLPERFSINLKGITGFDQEIILFSAGRELEEYETEAGLIGNVLWMPQDEKVRVFVQGHFLEHLLKEFLGTGKNNGYTAAEIAFLDYLCTRILSIFSHEHPLGRFRWLGFENSHSRVKTRCLVLSLYFSGVSGLMRIEIPHSAAGEILRIAERNLLKPGCANPSIYVSFVIAEAEIDAEELRDIETGALILFSSAYIRIESESRIGGVIMVRTDNNELITGYDIDNEEFVFEGHGGGQHQEEDKDTEALIGSVPLVLCVEVGRIRTRMSELKKLVPGRLLRIKKEGIEDVLLSVNGKVLGTGRLIKIGEEIGVEVISLRG